MKYYVLILGILQKISESIIDFLTTKTIVKRYPPELIYHNSNIILKYGLFKELKFRRTPYMFTMDNRIGYSVEFNTFINQSNSSPIKFNEITVNYINHQIKRYSKNKKIFYNDGISINYCVDLDTKYINQIQFTDSRRIVSTCISLIQPRSKEWNRLDINYYINKNNKYMSQLYFFYFESKEDEENYQKKSDTDIVDLDFKQIIVINNKNLEYGLSRVKINAEETTQIETFAPFKSRLNILNTDTEEKAVLALRNPMIFVGEYISTSTENTFKTHLKACDYFNSLDFDIERKLKE